MRQEKIAAYIPFVLKLVALSSYILLSDHVDESASDD